MTTTPPRKRWIKRVERWRSCSGVCPALKASARHSGGSYHASIPMQPRLVATESQLLGCRTRNG